MSICQGGKFIKPILWAILAFVIILQVHILALMLLHPVGGNEFHEIFAYSGGGRWAVARSVFSEYVMIDLVVAVLLIFFRYPLHWIIVIVIAAAITWLSWLRICLFPCQSASFHHACLPYLWIVPFLIVPVGFIAHVLSRRFFRQA